MENLPYVSDFSYSGWLLQNNLNPSDILPYTSKAKLLETLGLQKFMKTEACSTKEGVYKNPYQGWTSGPEEKQTKPIINMKKSFKAGVIN